MDPETQLDGPDGVPDNPGKVLYYKPRTGYRQNPSNNFGITATFSILWIVDRLNCVSRQLGTSRALRASPS